MPRPTGIAMTASIPCVAIVAGGRGCDVSGANRLVRVIRDREPARRPQPGGRLFGHDLTAYAFWSADDADAARLHLEAIGRSVTALPRAAPVSRGDPRRRPTAGRRAVQPSVTGLTMSATNRSADMARKTPVTT